MDEIEFSIGDVVTFIESEEHDPTQGIVLELPDSGTIFYKMEHLTLFNLQNRTSKENRVCLMVSPRYIINSKHYFKKQ